MNDHGEEYASMNSFSNIVGRKQAPKPNSDSMTEFVVRKAEPKTLTAKLVSTASDAKEDERGISDLLVQGLISRLPKPDTAWSLDDRAKWLRTADSIFSLVYTADDDEHREISVTLVKQTANSRTVP